MQPAKTLDIPSSSGNDAFGYSVAISGTVVVVGAPHHVSGGHDDAGAAYVFAADTGRNPIATLTNGNGAAYQEFGYSVAVADGIAVVGAPGKDNAPVDWPGHGSAYVFDAGSGNPKSYSPLTAPSPRDRDRFGFSVAIHGGSYGTTIAVGAPGDFEADDDPSPYNGNAYTFDAANGSATHTDGGLHHPGITLEDGDNYGFSVAVSQEKAVAGSRIDRILYDSGYAYLYDLRGGTGYQPYVVQPQDDKDFGRSVAVQGGALLAGSGVLKRNGWGTDSSANAGGVSVYDISDPTAAPSLATTISPPSPNGSFGASLALSGGGSVAVVGGPYLDGVGRAYAYQMTWTLPTPTIWLANDTGLHDDDRVTKEWGLDTDPPNPSFGAWWEYSFSYRQH